MGIEDRGGGRWEDGVERRGGEEEKGKGGEGRETGEESAREQCDMLPVSVCHQCVWWQYSSCATYVVVPISV